MSVVEEAFEAEAASKGGHTSTKKLQYLLSNTQRHISPGVIPGYREKKGGKHVGGMKQQAPSPPTGAKRAHPPEFMSFAPTPKPCVPAPHVGSNKKEGEEEEAEEEERGWGCF